MDFEVPVHGAGNGSLHEEQIRVGDDADDLQIPDGHLFASHSSCHPHALENARRVRGGADGAGCALAVTLAMGAEPAAEVMPLHDALEAAPFGRADNRDQVSLGEHAVHLDLLSRLDVRDAVAAEFADNACRLRFARRKVPLQGLVDQPFLLLVEAELHGLVTVPLLRLDLRDEAGACLNDRAGYHVTSLVKDAGHPDFFPE